MKGSVPSGLSLCVAAGWCSSPVGAVTHLYASAASVVHSPNLPCSQAAQCSMSTRQGPAASKRVPKSNRVRSICCFQTLFREKRKSSSRSTLPKDCGHPCCLRDITGCCYNNCGPADLPLPFVSQLQTSSVM